VCTSERLLLILTTAVGVEQRLGEPAVDLILRELDQIQRLVPADSRDRSREVWIEQQERGHIGGRRDLPAAGRFRSSAARYGITREALGGPALIIAESSCHLRYS
jgi:hypothetical protein